MQKRPGQALPGSRARARAGSQPGPGRLSLEVSSATCRWQSRQWSPGGGAGASVTAAQAVPAMDGAGRAAGPGGRDSKPAAASVTVPLRRLRRRRRRPRRRPDISPGPGRSHGGPRWSRWPGPGRAGCRGPAPALAFTGKTGPGPRLHCQVVNPALFTFKLKFPAGLY